eukprot:COSAG01_NODE_102_length_26290_cov_94.760299_25_plen_538_part_00
MVAADASRKRAPARRQQRGQASSTLAQALKRHQAVSPSSTQTLVPASTTMTTALAVVAMATLCPVLCIAQSTQTCSPGNHLDTSGNYRGCCVPDDPALQVTMTAATCPATCGGQNANPRNPRPVNPRQSPLTDFKCDCELCQSCDYLQLVQQNPAGLATCTARISHCDCVNCQCTCDMATEACQLDAACPSLVRALMSQASCSQADTPPCASGSATGAPGWCCVMPQDPQLVWGSQHQADCCANAACRNYVETASSTSCSTLTLGWTHGHFGSSDCWGATFFSGHLCVTNRDFFPTALTCPGPPPPGPTPPPPPSPNGGELQAGCGNVFTRVSEVNTACCPPCLRPPCHRRMQTCTPTTCSSSCATVFVPFLDDCSSNLQGAGLDLNPFFGLYFSCHQAAPSAGCAGLATTPEPEPEPEPLPAPRCPAGATAAPGARYCSDLVGVCLGPGHTGHTDYVSGKVKYGGFTRTACRAGCDAASACTGYDYRASSGDCSVYGPGVETDLRGGWRALFSPTTTIGGASGNSGVVCAAVAGRN